MQRPSISLLAISLPAISLLVRAGALALCVLGTPGLAHAQSAAPAAPASPAVPKETPPAPTTPMPPPASTTPQPVPPVPPPPASPKAAPPAPTTPQPPPASTTPEPAPTAPPLAPSHQPKAQEIEPNGAPATPGTATTEMVDVPSRTIVFVKGQSSYDDAFKSIKASLESLKAAMDKAGLTPTGHPLTIFSSTDDKGFSYEEAIPIAAVPQGKADLTNGAAFGKAPSGQALKFQHRGPYDEIDSTYATITSYLDSKGLQTDSPYIEEYLNELKTPDDPYLAVDIYIFLKK